MTEKKYTDWSRLPVDLQHQFFAHAEDESRKCKKKLLEQRKKLKEFGPFLRFEEIPNDDRWRKWRIASVDGSYSPAASERIGARYGAYCAGYMIFEGDELKKDAYRSDKLSQDQFGDPELTMQMLRLLCTKMERDLAFHCLEDEDVDLLLVDGSFFGFRVKLQQIRSEEIGIEEFRTVGDLADHIRDVTLRIMNSKRATGIIKRVRTTAFDGWLTYKNRNENNCIRRNDRAILAALMPEDRWFAYEQLLESPDAFNFFSRFRTRYKILTRAGVKSMGAILETAKSKMKTDVKRSLRCSAADILQTARYYVRCTRSAPPFCFETHKDVDVRPIIAYFQANHNPATGLPFPIDLIDENVSLPGGFTREFVEEVEALLIRDPELDRFDLSNYFMSINPQKEE